MRHSSWTLFLVPLALPLVLLLPGAAKKEDPASPVAKPSYEQFREQGPSRTPQFGTEKATGENPSEDLFEALHRD